jgi:hypothetical protein
LKISLGKRGKMKLAVGIVPFLALLSSVEVLGWKEHCKCFEEITRNKRRFCRKRRGLQGYAESGVGDAENSKYQNVVDLFYERGLSVEEMDGEQEENIDDTSHSNERDLIYDTESEFYDLFAEEFEDTNELDDNEVDFADNLSSLGDDISGESRELSRGCSRLKMWHKKGWSCWQFELEDRKWCMSYRKGRSSFRIETCRESSSQRLKLIDQMIQVGGKCLEHTGGQSIVPRSCNGNRRQRWKFYKVKGKGDEIRPAGNSRLCVTQPHHPRSGEILRATRCSVPRRTFHRSAWWECDDE